MNAEMQALKSRQAAERQELFAKQRAEQEAFTEAQKGAQNEAQVVANLAIEKRVDELRPLDPGSAGAWHTARS